MSLRACGSGIGSPGSWLIATASRRASSFRKSKIRAEVGPSIPVKIGTAPREGHRIGAARPPEGGALLGAKFPGGQGECIVNGPEGGATKKSGDFAVAHANATPVGL
jgi:hypothetical protein